jgi:nucleoside-diphosphate-sugar epimerase
MHDMATMHLSEPIAILGASSHIAQDFIRTAQKRFAPDFRLYARRPEVVAELLRRHNGEDRYPVAALSEFGKTPYSAAINFIGVGDPARARDMGAEIFSVTLDFDRMVLEYLRKKPDTIYIFMSSGAVYGTLFSAPASEDSKATVAVNNLQPQDYYGVAKLYAETLHRAATQNTIFDIRIFNYFSRTVDLNSRFLITDLINATRSGSVFKTDNSTVVRDFLHPDDFCRLIEACLAAPAGTNLPVDAYSQAPISKPELLQLMNEEFGLRHDIVPAAKMLNATGAKPYYFSTNRRASTLGYRPTHSSKSGIFEELSAILVDKD